MIKNSIISLLLIYILNMYEGWKVAGISRITISVILVVLLTIIISLLEDIIVDEIERMKNNG